MEEDKDLIIISKEIDSHQRSSTYGKLFRVAASVKGKPPDTSLILLNKLTTDQVHVFGRNMGVPGCFSKSKFLCCVAIANHFNFHNRLGKYGLSPTARANQTTSNLSRAINMVFSANFVNSLKMVNDKEADITHKDVWIRAALAYNYRHDNDVVCNMNEVMHDTIDTAAAVASQFDAEEMEDESVNVDATLGVTKNSSTDGLTSAHYTGIRQTNK